MKNIKYIAITLVVVIAIASFLYYISLPKKVLDPEPILSVKMLKCELDMRGDGTFSFFFDVNVKKNEIRYPAEIYFKINKIYNLENYKIDREYELEKSYGFNETIENMSFVIDRIYKDYMYLPSQNFDFQLFYCEFTDMQKEYMKYSNISTFDAIDEYCLLIYDYEMSRGEYIHIVSQNPGEQCSVIQR
jgi:hypothetical protein